MAWLDVQLGVVRRVALLIVRRVVPALLNAIVVLLLDAGVLDGALGRALLGLLSS